METNYHLTGAASDDPDEYRADNIFWAPPKARWQKMQTQARLPAIGQTADAVMLTIERQNPSVVFQAAAGQRNRRLCFGLVSIYSIRLPPTQVGRPSVL